MSNWYAKWAFCGWSVRLKCLNAVKTLWMCFGQVTKWKCHTSVFSSPAVMCDVSLSGWMISKTECRTGPWYVIIIKRFVTYLSSLQTLQTLLCAVLHSGEQWSNGSTSRQSKLMKTKSEITKLDHKLSSGTADRHRLTIYDSVRVFRRGVFLWDLFVVCSVGWMCK